MYYCPIHDLEFTDECPQCRCFHQWIDCDDGISRCGWCEREYRTEPEYAVNGPWHGDPDSSHGEWP